MTLSISVAVCLVVILAIVVYRRRHQNTVNTIEEQTIAEALAEEVVLAEPESNLAKGVRERLQVFRNRELELWWRVASNSAAYMKALRFRSHELPTLERQQGRSGSLYPDLADLGGHGFLTFTLEAKTFSLFVKHVCAVDYGVGWTNVVMAVCVNDGTMNETAGYGTSLITALPEEWHEKVMTKLSERDTEESSDTAQVAS